jgi:hypothetical protein
LPTHRSNTDIKPVQQAALDHAHPLLHNGIDTFVRSTTKDVAPLLYIRPIGAKIALVSNPVDPKLYRLPNPLRAISFNEP